MRRSAIILGVHRKTIERKLPFLGERARRWNVKYLGGMRSKIHSIQIDDLITKENSKLKPLSVSVAVDERTRTLLALEVSQIPAFGHLAKLAVKKYGRRQDQHQQGLERLFDTITPLLQAEVRVRSDEHQRYPYYVAKYLPRARHECFKSERATVAGQGELKKVRFDPLFAVNHACAMLRGNVNRLIRKTWCTTKDPNRLKDHLDLFMHYYNQHLLGAPLTPS